MTSRDILLPLFLLFAVGAYYTIFATQLRNWQVRVLNSHWYVLGVRVFGIWLMLLAAGVTYVLVSRHVVTLPH